MFPFESSAIPSTPLSPVLEPEIVALGVTLPLLPAG
jgi:hypothetical protein